MLNRKTIVHLLGAFGLSILITGIGTGLSFLVPPEYLPSKADNFLITSTAFIFSPPFVPLVANALKNKDVIVTGIAGGVLGYMLGNYFGFTLAHILERL